MPPERFGRWLDNFAARHGDVDVGVVAGRLRLEGADGAVASAALPFGRSYDGGADPAAFAAAAADPIRWGVLLVRKGGFAVAAVEGADLVASKVGQRHVQGRTKAGGQSSQRFSRRRENQARQAYEAAAERAHRVLVAETAPVEALVCGGDRRAVAVVLSDARLAPLAAVRCEPWLAVPDPRRSVLEEAVASGRSVRIDLTGSAA